ncbi:related to EPL1 - Component of histone H4/H2A acetyltransferase complex [Ustilago sp. UG-2017b]|nr:related to EPL1 - Component of histone H4/H2A acetyltransferase complex [Ustilago sp. UG-2017b]
MARGAAPVPAATTSSRVRNKKLSYRQKLCVQRGSHLLNAATSVVAGPEPEFEGQEHAQDSNLGVDASEISEHHLQAALSSNQLATSEGNAAAETAKAAYSIPVPDAHGTLSNAEFAQLYPPGVYSDPVTYIRYSDTVEDCIKGPSYNMDEDDQDWLETRNAKAQEDLTAAIRSAKTGPLAGSGGKGKAKEKLRKEAIEKLIAENQASYRQMSEDQFEMIMTVFEQVTSEQVPFLHLDVTKIPTSEELLAYFEPNSSISALAQPDLPPLSWEKTVSAAGPSNTTAGAQARRLSIAGAAASRSASSTEWSPLNPYKNLADLKNLAGIVYPHWKSRREDREGRTVTPYLNFDETNDNDPYVCFRRREVKQIRKTRKTDALHIEKMIRLRAELEHAVALTELVARREKTKRASLRQSRECWENIKDLMDIKRQWGIVGPQQGLEDDELISGERRDQTHSASGPAKKKRKTDEAATTIKLAGRRSRAGEGEGAASGAAASAAGVSGMGSAILERVHAVQAYIERECLRKADADLGWEEGSDAAFQPIPAPAPLRAFRPIHAESSEDPLPFSPLSIRAGRPPSFRRRVGRGGRVLLDRRLPIPSPVPTSLTDWPRYGRPRSQLPGVVESHESRPTEPDSTSTLPDVASTSSLASSKKTLTGPFAFSPDAHPQLLASTTHPSVQSLLNQGNDAFGGPFARNGPFAGPTPSNSQGEVSGSQHSDASSTSSDSSDRSRLSGTSVGVVSTQATEVGDIDMLGLDEEHDKEEREEQRDASDSDESDSKLSEPERELQRWTRMEERWRYDDESGRFAGLGLTALGGMEDDDEAVLDDFDQRFMRYRMTLLEEADLLKLSTDLTNLQQAQAAAEAPSPKPAGYVEQPASSTSSAVANAVVASSKAAAVTVAAPTGTLPGIPNAATLPIPSAARTAAATGGGGSQSALQAQQLQAQQQQLQLAILQQQQQQQQQAAAAQAQAQAQAQAAAAAAQAQAQAQAQQAALLQQQQKQQQQHQKSQQMPQQSPVQSHQQAQQQQQAQNVTAQQLPQPFGSQIMSLSHNNTQQAQLAAFAAAQQQLQAAQQAVVQQQQQQQQRMSGVTNAQQQPQQQQFGLPVQMQMQMPIQLQMQLQMQMAAAAAQGQTHLLGQSMPFDATSVQAQMQQAQQHLARSMPAQSMAHSSPMQAAAFAVPNAQPFGMNLSLNMNGNAGSPPMQHARVSSQPQQHARTSASPVSAAAATNGQNTARTNPSPIMQAGLVQQQQAQQQQQQAQQAGQLNLNLSLAAAQMQSGAVNLQQFQALQQQAQMLPQAQTGKATAAQLMAMKAALAQNANLNLRLPPNRALQIAQQAAQKAFNSQQQAQLQQVQQQQQAAAQQAQGNGNASNQGSPAMSRASTAGSPRFAANGINGAMAGSSPVQNGTSATTNATNSPSPQISAANRAAIAAATNAANAKMMAQQSPVSYHASPVQANLNLHAAQQQQLQNAAAAAVAAAAAAGANAGSPHLATRASPQTQQG